MMRIMLVDDHAVVLAGLSEIVRTAKDMEVVGHANNATEALQCMRTHPADVVLLDIQLPDLSGLYVTHALLQRAPQTKVIILTSAISDFFPVRLFAAGVWGYLHKSTNATEILSAIRSVVIGDRVVAPELATRLALARVEPCTLSEFEVLSDKALEVAMMVVRGIASSEIAKHLHLSVATVHSYRSTIFKKMGVSNDVALAKLALEEGIISANST